MLPCAERFCMVCPMCLFVLICSVFKDVEALGVHKELACEEVPRKDDNGHYQFGNKVMDTHFLRKEPDASLEENQADCPDEKDTCYLARTGFRFAAEDEKLSDGIVGQRPRNKTQKRRHKVGNTNDVGSKEIGAIINNKRPYRHKTIAEELEQDVVGILAKQDVR